MKYRLAWMVWLGLSGALAGCQCCQLTECYQDKIDCIADHKLCLDRWYHPTWDLSRIGYPDWCEGPINHHFYGCCCRCCRQQPPYDHMPLFVVSQDDPARQPHIPPIPPVDPNSPLNLPNPGDSIGPTLSPTPDDLNKPSVIPDPKALDLSLPPQGAPLEFPRAPDAPAFPVPEPARPMITPMPESNGAKRDSLFVPANHEETVKAEAVPVLKAADFPTVQWTSQAPAKIQPPVRSSPRFAPAIPEAPAGK